VSQPARQLEVSLLASSFLQVLIDTPTEAKKSAEPKKPAESKKPANPKKIVEVSKPVKAKKGVVPGQTSPLKELPG